MTESRDELLKELTTGLENFSLPVTEQQKQQLCEFLVILAKWNQSYNLTAITETKDLVIKHVLDSLFVAPFLYGEKILDVGTGAGLPGIPLSIIKPNWRFVVIDSSRKKTNFVQYVITSLGLTNVTVVHARVENYRPVELAKQTPTNPDDVTISAESNIWQLFDVIISRAFSSLDQFVLSSAHLCHADGFFVAMKGKVAQAKTELLPEGYVLTKIETVTVPGLIGERCLVFVRKQSQESKI